MALIIDDVPQFALVLIGPRGSGKAGFSDAQRSIPGTTVVQTTAQLTIEEFDNTNYNATSSWPQASI
jgi:hypothetical protein